MATWLLWSIWLGNVAVEIHYWTQNISEHGNMNSILHLFILLLSVATWLWGTLQENLAVILKLVTIMAALQCTVLVTLKSLITNLCIQLLSIANWFHLTSENLAVILKLATIMAALHYTMLIRMVILKLQCVYWTTIKELCQTSATIQSEMVS